MKVTTKARADVPRVPDLKMARVVDQGGLPASWAGLRTNAVTQFHPPGLKVVT